MILICYDGSADARAAEGAVLAGGLGMAATSKAALARHHHRPRDPCQGGRQWTQPRS
jgi:hypothetical protein